VQTATDRDEVLFVRFDELQLTGQVLNELVGSILGLDVRKADLAENL